jgi:hypothetical protein
VRADYLLGFLSGSKIPFLQTIVADLGDQLVDPRCNPPLLIFQKAGMPSASSGSKAEDERASGPSPLLVS